MLPESCCLLYDEYHWLFRDSIASSDASVLACVLCLVEVSVELTVLEVGVSEGLYDDEPRGS